MELQGNPGDAVVIGELHRLLPVGDQNLVPLVVQNLAIIRGPGAGDPVGILGAGAVPGAAGEGDDGIQSQQLRRQNRLLKDLVVMLRNLLLGVHRVSMAGQGGDLQAVLCQKLFQSLGFGGILDQLLPLKVIAVGVASCAQLHHFHSQAAEIAERLLGRLVL
jgi:hypothetical protein